MSEIFKAHPKGPTPDVFPLFPQCLTKTENCETTVQIGVFFDGTGNNQDWDEAEGCNPGLGMTQRQARKDSNVARLYQAFPEQPQLGLHRLYIPGVGTPFPDIGEDDYAMFGPSMGRGGDGRINFALLGVLDFIHQAVASGRRAYAPETFMALCRNGTRTYNPKTLSYTPLAGSVQDSQALDAVGMRTIGGLLCEANGRRAHAEAFFHNQAQRIAEKVAKATQPTLINITIDVFGFSRGAAQARVFCNWLSPLLKGDRLCGVPTQLRFLGIFDTVASVGISDSLGGDGHFAWAKPESLRIPDTVHQCVHYIAMHENRTSFPLESIRLADGSLPKRAIQLALPGMHSDVGGGYGHTSQGRSPSGQASDVLSQIPLELMYQAAKTAQVPLNKKLANDGAYNPFDIHPDVRNAYTAFMSASPCEATTAQWLLPYLAWRYQVRTVYATRLSWVQRANEQDRKDMAGANETLSADIAALTGMTEEEMDRYRLAAQWSPELFAGLAVQKGLRRATLAAEASEVLTHLKAHAPLGTPENPENLTPEAFLFANYVHDSYAGFRPLHQPHWLTGCVDLVPGSWETQGYLRYRRIYRGSNRPITNAPLTEQQQHEAAQHEREVHKRSLQNSIDTRKLFNGPW
ncbi:DUF2235 domain-containing protein [Pseudomonas sp. R5(2019)]|nr:DUF2235 domain-containing protein [Pseudomonas sp. R5(2019)]